MSSCSKCGQPHVTRHGGPACTGHSLYSAPGVKRDTPKPCSKAPMRGQKVCGSHGGRSPQAKARAARTLVVQEIEADARAILASQGIEGATDYLGVMQELLVESLALKQAIGAKLNALNGQIRHTNERGDEQARTEFVAFERSLDRAMKFAEILHRADRGTADSEAKSLLLDLGKALGVIE